MKRNVFLFIFTVLTIFVFSVAVSAQVYTGEFGDNLTWSFDTYTGVLEVKGMGEMQQLSNVDDPPWYSFRYSIKSVYINEGITSVSNFAFSNCLKMTNFFIPSSVTYIGDEALLGSTGIESITVAEDNKHYSSDEFGVLFDKNKTKLLEYPKGNARTEYTIPHGVASIANSAFNRCNNLNNVIIPNSVTSIGNSAFSYCANLINAVIPNGVITIGSSAFSNCERLTNAIIPASVISIEGAIFDDCISLANITVDNANKYYLSDEFGVLFKKDKSILLQYPAGNARTEYTIPNSVTYINNRAFEGCINLTSVVIPNSVTYIGTYTFAFCENLAKIVIPDSVTYIGPCAFSECYKLTEVILSEGLLKIETGAFQNCKELTSIIIPQSVTYIGSLTFIGCSKLTSIIVDADNLKYSSDEYGVLFNKEKTILLQYPAGNVSKNYTIPKTVSSIDTMAFYYSENLTGIVIPQGITSIDMYAFYGCTGLESVIIPDSVSSIGAYTFAYCKNLKSIIIPESVAFIDDYAFTDCLKLTIYGYSGSFAESYTKNKRYLKFIAIPLGDTDGNSVVNALDGVKFARYLAGWNRCEISESVLLDFNTDDQIDTVDLLILLRHIAGWKSYETLFEI